MIEDEDELSVGDDGRRAWDVMLVVDEGGGEDKGNSLRVLQQLLHQTPTLLRATPAQTFASRSHLHLTP